jgi:RNA polymerase sigma factor (sigma-70 family)
MSGTPSSVHVDADDLFARARAGDDAAWEQLFNSCYDKVRRAASRRLSPQLRTLYDSTDVASSVFSSLFAKSDRFDFQSVEELRRHLQHAAEQKVIDEFRRQNRRKRRRDLQENFSALEDGERSSYDPAGPTPTPSQFAQARETHEHLLEMNRGPANDVIARKVQGETNEDVARATGLHLRAVQRIVKKAYDSWQQRGTRRP